MLVDGGGRSTDTAGYPMRGDRRVVALATEAEDAGEVSKAGPSPRAFLIPVDEAMKNPTGGMETKRDIAELTEGGVDLGRGDGSEHLVFGTASMVFDNDAYRGFRPFDRGQDDDFVSIGSAEKEAGKLWDGLGVSGARRGIPHDRDSRERK